MGFVYAILVILSSAGFLYFLGMSDKNSKKQAGKDIS